MWLGERRSTTRESLKHQTGSRCALDGVPLQTERTAIKKLQHPDPNFSENPLWAVTFGSFLPPGSLSLGSHEIQTTGTDGFALTTPFSVIAC